MSGTLEKSVGVVVIGRNEGERLKRCLRSIPPGLAAAYVDSGSTDGSLEFARSIGVDVIELDKNVGFTAARARNTGWQRLQKRDPDLEFVQFIDGDCEMDRDWLATALRAIQSDSDLAVVFGRRRERFPEASVYNQMCDDEWDVPIGLVSSCGGDALFRIAALKLAGGYSDDLIAGEEPDLCLRLRAKGWTIRRIDAEMTLHDANILSLSSYWKRAERAGFAYAEHVRRHGENADPQKRKQVASILVWGLLLPLGAVTLGGLMITMNPWLAILALLGAVGVYAAQTARIALKKYRSGADWGFAWSYGLLIVVGKFAEGTGVIRCAADRLFRRRSQIIEYK